MLSINRQSFEHFPVTQPDVVAKWLSICPRVETGWRGQVGLGGHSSAEIL